MDNPNHDSCEPCAEAMLLLKRGLELLDGSDAPGDIGAHLDLAICRLNEYLKAMQGFARMSVAASGGLRH